MAGRCECSDPGCPVHYGSVSCVGNALFVAFRYDTEDSTGTAMCDECTDDALDSGLFYTED